MVDIPSLEDAAKQRAVDYVTRLLESPENLEKLDMLRMKARRQCEAMDTQLKSAMQSQLEDIKTGLDQLHGKFWWKLRNNCSKIETFRLCYSWKGGSCKFWRS